MYGKNYAVRDLSLQITQSKNIRACWRIRMWKISNRIFTVAFSSKPGVIEKGSIMYNDMNPLQCPDATLQSIRGKTCDDNFRNQ
jgi:hypothetical protein